MLLEKLFDIKHAIFQAPMAGAANVELVSAVCNAGGLGGLGAAGMKPDVLRQQIHAIRAQTEKPFNINLFALESEQFDSTATMGPGLRELMEQFHEEKSLGEIPGPKGIFGPVEDQLNVLIEEKVPVISFHFGVDAEHVKKIHSAGLKVVSSATTVREAIRLEDLGVDAVIAQGSEAGGHRGTFMGDVALVGTLALVPQVVDAIKIPVIAAGGIMDARGIVACRALGAAGVQMGTAFLACPEVKLSPAWLERLYSAESEDTTVTRAISGKAARGIRNRFIESVENLDEALLPYPLQYSISNKLRQAATAQGDADFMALWSGQGTRLIQAMPAADLLRRLVAESAREAKRIGVLLGNL